jgi:AcrR family transcriptional regulator
MNSTPKQSLSAESPAALVQSTSRHDLVLDEAARQLNAKGVLLTSLAEIAAKLGVSRGAMYYYVADREDMVFQCYRRAAEVTARHLHEAGRDGGNAASVLRAFIQRMLDPNEPELAARAETAMMNTTQRDTIQGLNDALLTRLAHLLEVGQREGDLRSCDVEVNARVLLSLVTWAPLARPWAHSVGPLGPRRAIDAAVATIFEGLAAPDTKFDFQPMDLSALLPRAVPAFDRAATMAAKREALLCEASRLFNRKGIDATSLEEIAARVGATKRTVHHHIGSKAELVQACYDRAFRIFFFIRDRCVEYPGTPLQALVTAMHALALTYPSDALTPLSPLVGYSALSTQGQARIDEYTTALGTAYRELMNRGQAEGSMSAMDIDARSLMLPGLLSWLVKDDVPTDLPRQQHIATEIANLVAIGLRRRS